MDNDSQVVTRTVAGDWVFKGLFVAFVYLFFSFSDIQAQCLPTKMPLNNGEVVNYDIYFKWGFLMPRAGQGKISFNRSTYKGEPAFLYRLDFQTTKFFDSIYKMRDTLDCFYGQNYALLHSSKRTNEGGYYLIDDLHFSYTGNKTNIRSHRYTPEQTKIDTVLTVASGCASDMLGTAFWLRTLDWSRMKMGESYPLTVAIGRDLVKMSFRYQGQAVVEHGDSKYRTHYFAIDIFDDAFEQSKSAAELWVGDDENRIPIKIRTKLKIGYAEVYYKNSSNLKTPLTCQVRMKK